MADVMPPVACEACGRQLPPQQGKGRRRRFCNASCRSSARYRRRLAGSRELPGVKDSLTDEQRHVRLDAVGGSRPADPVALRIRDAAGRLAAESGARGAGGGSPLEALAAARDLAAAANQALQEAVDRARSADRSWREIGDVLGTSRQAAFQRFGHPVDPRTGTPMSRDVPPGAADRAVALVTRLVQGRWEEVVGEFDEHMRERVDAGRLAGGWAHTIGMIGSFERMGEPFAHQAGDDTMVDIPLRFEAGEAIGFIRFDRDGKVAGLLLRPASPEPHRERNLPDD
jgi:hypothetical protein